jgi:hypothetical protein
MPELSYKCLKQLLTQHPNRTYISHITTNKTLQVVVFITQRKKQKNAVNPIIYVMCQMQQSLQDGLLPFLSVILPYLPASKKRIGDTNAMRTKQHTHAEYCHQQQCPTPAGVQPMHDCGGHVVSACGCSLWLWSACSQLLLSTCAGICC